MHASGIPASAALGLVLSTYATAANGASQCVSIEDDARRLQCYDLENGHRSGPAPEGHSGAPESDAERRILEDAARSTFSLTAYRPNYVSFTHLDSVNRAPHEPAQRNLLGNEEIKFQISTAVKLMDDVVFGNGDLWIGYSQAAYWQALRPGLSSPVREVDYEPDLHLSFLADLPLLGLTVRNVDVGIVHQSNGRAEPLSRSWNRVFADVDVLAGSWSFNLRTWVRLHEDPHDDDNPDIMNYLGWYEVRTSWQHADHTLSLTLRNVFSSDGRYGAELGWTFPLAGRLRGMVQWFSGYGENLIDYDHANHRIGVGFVFGD